MVRAILGLLLLVGLPTLAAAQSGPAEDSLYGTPSEARWAPFFAVLPNCDDPDVLNFVQRRFSETEQTYWGGLHFIGAFDGVREIGFRANGLSYIPRRYCVARGEMVDPNAVVRDRTQLRTVVYSIGANTGVISWSWGVEWCVVGLDRMRAYAPDCLVLRPIIDRVIGEYKPVHRLGLKARD
jgi:hypothetical protein